jgi:hypothetical protein
MLIACASTGATAPDAYVITAPELNRSRSTNTDAAIRPSALNCSVPGSPAPSVLHDSHAGGLARPYSRAGIEVLGATSTDLVARIEYVRASEAARKYGPGLGKGNVLVTKEPVPSPNQGADKAHHYRGQGMRHRTPT